MLAPNKAPNQPKYLLDALVSNFGTGSKDCKATFEKSFGPPRVTKDDITVSKGRTRWEREPERISDAGRHKFLNGARSGPVKGTG